MGNAGGARERPPDIKVKGYRGLGGVVGAKRGAGCVQCGTARVEGEDRGRMSDRRRGGEGEPLRGRRVLTDGWHLAPR